MLIKIITDNKEFWKIIKPFLDFFGRAVKELDINMDKAKVNEEPVLLTNPVHAVIQEFENHPSIKLIRDNVNLRDIFKFASVSLGVILRKVTNINNAKKGTKILLKIFQLVA